MNISDITDMHHARYYGHHDIADTTHDITNITTILETCTMHDITDSTI